MTKAEAREILIGEWHDASMWKYRFAGWGDQYEKKEYEYYTNLYDALKIAIEALKEDNDGQN